ncbi:MAG: DUF59 domain-containing protein [Rhodospirillales bacterium]
MFGLFKKKDTAKQETVAEETAVRSDDEIRAAEDKVRDTLDVRAEKERETSGGNGGQRVEMDEFVPPPGMSGGTPSGIPGFDYSPVDPNEEFKATGGEPLEDGVPVATEEAIVAALQTVYDPEIPVNIYDLGLIYGLEIGEKGEIKIDMTLTAPGCPVAGEMPGMVVRAVEPVDGTGEIEVSLVWEPQWTPDRMSDDAKLALGF